MATMERPKKTKKANKQAYRYESIAQQPEPNPDSGDCDHFGLKSPETSVLLLPSSTRDIDKYLGEFETPGLPGEKDLPPLSSEEPSEAVPSKRRTTLTAAIKRSFSGFTKNGPDTGADILENRNDNSNNERSQNKITEAESLENEEPLDVYAMFAKTTPLKTDEHAQSDEIKRIRTREQMVESLQSLRDVCLHTLDRLLSVLLSKASLSPNGYRLEDGTEGSTQAISTETDDNSSNEDLLRSIYFKSNRLANERSGPRGEGSHQTAVPDAELSPLTADNNEKYLLAIQERLDACSPSVPTDDYTLTSGLASLLNGVYHIMQDCDVPKETKSANELAPSANSETSSTPPPVANSAAASSNLANSNDKVLYSTLRQRMDKVMGQRAASEGTLLATRSDTPSSLWRETDRVMELVAGLLRDRSETSQKRAVSHTDMASLPSYGDIHSSGEHLTGDKQANSTGKKKSARLSLQPEDICNVLSALDRVMEVVPRMNNQRVNLSDKQERAIAAASLSKAIVRLSKGRLEGQRADTSGRQQRLDALDHMLDRIAKSSTSQFNDQRVSLTDNQTKNLELAKITGVLDKASKKRMEKQEWQSSKQIKENDMNKLNRQLEDTMSLELETQQRYTLSAHKEKEMFMSNIMGKMNRLSDRRMNGQDAMSQLERKHERFQEIDTVMDRMTRGLDEQKFCKPPSALPAVSSSRATNHHRSLESLQPDVSIPPRTASPRTPNQLSR